MGRCANLGYPYRRLNPDLRDVYRGLRDADENGLAPEIRYMADFVIENTRREIYVQENSSWHRILAKHITAGRIETISRDEIFRVAFTRGTLFFMDAHELSGAIGSELRSYVGVYPPGIVTSRQLNVLAEHFEYLKGMADAIDNCYRANGKKFIFLCNPGYNDMVLCDVLYLLTDAIDAVIKESYNGRFYSENFGPILHANQLAELDDSQYAVLVNNGDGLAIGYDGRVGSFRSHLLYNLEYYFIFGVERPLAPRRLAYRPIILWLLHAGGTNRMQPVWVKIMKYFGIGYSVSADFNPTFVPLYDTPLRRSADVFRNDDIEYEKYDAVVNLYNVLSHSTCMLVHSNEYRMKDIIAATNAKVVVGIRDPRDILVSLGALTHGGWVRHFKRDRKQLLEPFSPYLKKLQGITRSILEIKDNPNVTFIKFEDVDRNPVGAYARLVEELFPDDPVYVEEPLSRIIREAAIEAMPENQSHYRTFDEAGESLGLPQHSYGSARKWEDYFTEQMKDSFKANSNGFLQAFGYEKDDNW